MFLLLPLSLAATAALAQDAPSFDGQLVRPSVDSQATLWTDDAAVVEGFVGRGTLSYARDPVLLVDVNAHQGDSLVGDLLQLDLAAGWGVGPLRAALVIPVVTASSDLYSGAFGVGDLGLDVKGQLADPDDGFGFALTGRLTAPTGTDTVPLGAAGVGYDIRAVLDKPIGDLRLLANVGYQGRPDGELDPILAGDALLFRVGAGYALGQAGGVSVDLGGAPNLAQLDDPYAVPVEVLAGGWARVSDTLVLRGGAGTGVTKGIGAARARVLFGLGWWPAVEDGDPDGDGIIGAGDRCPMDAEDKDGIADDDGCPEDTTRLTLLIKDPYGGAVSEARVTLWKGDEQFDGTAAGDVLVDPGPWRIHVEADGYETLDDLFTVTANEPLQLVKVLEPEPTMFPMGRVTVTADKIEIAEKIYFQTGSADIRMESFDLLQEIAGTIRDHPEVTRIRVEGHTDSRGAAEVNLRLSQERAESVVDFLVEHGVARSRLTARGWGEEQPVDPRETEAAWDRNRRVEFVIEQRN